MGKDSQLFKHVACFTDIHLGLKHNSITHNDDCKNFIEWFISEAKKRECDTCIFLGDFHHHRASINVNTLNYTMLIFELLNDAFDKVYIITGNHDLYYREKRGIHSLVIGKRFNNIVLIDEPFTKGNVSIVPWLMENEWKKIKQIKSKYMFGHFELPGFKMNARIEMPDHGGINRHHFKHQDYVFSGHFHKRQGDGHIQYIGNPFGHNYSDALDFNRGAMFLKWGDIPEYVNWEDGPRYVTCYLSELLENADDILKPNTYVRVTLDLDLLYEEANFLKETYVENYKIRELNFIYDRSSEEIIEFEGEITFQTVDEIVLEQLRSIDSNTFDPHKLMDLYGNL